MQNYILRAMDKNKSFRVFVAQTTEMVETARKTHKTTPVATAALGRLITATSIMGVMLKNEKDKISIQFRCDGPAKEMVAVSNSTGNVKAYIANPNLDIYLKENGKLDVGKAMGAGEIIVIKDLGLKEPYVGKSNIVTGEIAEDLANYFVVSEQQPSAVALGVSVGKEMNVESAGGLIIQVLPNISEDDLSLLEYKLETMVPMSELIKKGFTPEEIIEGVFGDMEMEIYEKTEVSFKCDCSRERMEQVLISLGKKELSEIAEEDENAEIKCHFCETSYKFDKENLQKLIEEI